MDGSERLSRSQKTPLERGRAYLRKIPHAVEGDNGNGTTLQAIYVGHDFGIELDEWLPDLLQWNQSCEPPWRERELEAKAKSAYRNAIKPFGWRLEATSTRRVKRQGRTPEAHSDVSDVSDVSDSERRRRADASLCWNGASSVCSDSVVVKWLDLRGMSAAAVEEAELAKVLQPTQEWAEEFRRTGYKCLIPVYDAAGALCGLRGRNVSGRDPKSKVPKGFVSRGRVMADANGRSLLKGRRPKCWDGRVVIAEGEVDYLLWATHWGEAAESTPATLGIVQGSWTKEIASRIPDGAEVFVRSHDDEAGQKFTRQIAETLVGRCRVRALIEDGFNDDGERVLAGRLPSDPAEGTVVVEAQNEPAHDELADSIEEPEEANQSQVQVIAELITSGGGELWSTPDGVPWMTIRVGGHSEHYRLNSSKGTQAIRKAFWDSEERALSKHQLENAVAHLSALAVFEGGEHHVHLRVARVDNTIWLDLADPEWRAVRINSDGWETVAYPPVKFRRGPTSLALPEPSHNRGGLKGLRELMNLEGEGDFDLIIAWWLSSLSGAGPYPVLSLSGEQGSGKSRNAAMIKGLIDPEGEDPSGWCDLGTAPRKLEDLWVRTTASHVVCADNLSSVSQAMSDACCCIATGGAYQTRRLYAQGEQHTIRAIKPQILSGLDPLSGASPDLGSRAVMLEIPHLRPEDRLDERQMLARYTEHKASALGELCSAVSVALQHDEEVDTTAAGRMVDMLRWSDAARSYFGWSADHIERLYEANQQRSEQQVLADDIVAVSVDWLTSKDPDWSGSPTQLYRELSTHEAWQSSGADAPKSVRALGKRLTKLRPALRSHGIEFVRTRGRERRYVFTRTNVETSETSPTVSTSAIVVEEMSTKTTPLDRAGGDDE